MTITTTGLTTINLVCVPTLEQDKAIAFYESLGFEKRTDQPFGGGYRWIEVYPPEGTTGIALALSIWVTGTAVGLSALLRASGELLFVLKLVGAVYLAYLGVRE